MNLTCSALLVTLMVSAAAFGAGAAERGESRATPSDRTLSPRSSVKAGGVVSSVSADEDAMAWIRRAAERGDPESQFELGRCYLKGEGVIQDRAEAVRWYRRAADQGVARAQFALGVCYFTGSGVAADRAEAVRWYRKAAEQGERRAQYHLAQCYRGGDGIERDVKLAAEWFRRAAEQGDQNAQYDLGVHYLTGAGVLQDEIEGVRWLLLAAANGSEPAIRKLPEYRTGISAGHYSEAQRRARNWMTEFEARAAAGTPELVMPRSRGNTTGTGFFITDDGYFLTSAHVISGAPGVLVQVGDTLCKSALVGMDFANDVALLKVDGRTFPPIPLRDAAGEMGERVATIGFPNPAIQGYSPKYTDGTISSVKGLKDDVRMYQISVPVQMGNSGGPLLDEAGNCVGLVLAKIDAVKTLQHTGDLPQNINFALKVAHLAPLLNRVPGLLQRLPPAREGRAVKPAEREGSVGMVMAGREAR